MEDTKAYHVMVKLVGWKKALPQGHFNIPFRYTLIKATELALKISVDYPTADVKIEEV
jgi:hypothetical protein